VRRVSRSHLEVGADGALGGNLHLQQRAVPALQVVAQQLPFLVLHLRDLRLCLNATGGGFLFFTHCQSIDYLWRGIMEKGKDV
jgi:hypothetical protein